MTRPHVPRPTDLVALVSFDGEVFPNQAVTRDRLGRPNAAPHPLAAAIQHWLGIGRRVWIDVLGRQIRGIATARELCDQSVWEVDTLVAADDDESAGVAQGLLQQAADAAAEASVSRILLRLAVDAPALRAAARVGFVRALEERLWTGALRTSGRADSPAVTAQSVREPARDEQFAEFQLYSRAIPAEARAALAMTFDEWTALQERRWAGKHAREYVAVDAGAIRGSLVVGSTQFMLLVDPASSAAGEALLQVASDQLDTGERVYALLPDCTGTPATALEAAGMEPQESYLLLVLRTAQPVRSEVRETVRAARTVVPTSG